MKLESQVCSLELAKQLKSLGIKQDSLFYWVKTVIGEPIVNFLRLGLMPTRGDKVLCSAFTVAELGELLPEQSCTFGKGELETKEVVSMGYGKWLGCWTDHKGYYVDFSETTEANLRAKMLIWLIENKYLVI